MGLSSDSSVYDYVIMDSNGIVGVKDGKKTPISEEEWKKAHPEHRNTECSECTFVQDKEQLFVFSVPRDLKDKATHEPMFVGKFTMTDWTGHSGFYLFKCKECYKVSVDYPHGYRENGCLYIRCDRCRFEIVFYPSQYKEVYERENAVAPPTFWEELKGAWRFRKRIKEFRKSVGQIEDKQGVRVMIKGKIISKGRSD